MLDFRYQVQVLLVSGVTVSGVRAVQQLQRRVGLNSAELAASCAGRNQAGAETRLTDFVIPGLTLNPVRIKIIALWMPDQVRHDKRRVKVFLDFDLIPESLN
jgi:hypothetical protein